MFLDLRGHRAHGHLQHQEPGPAGPEEAPEQGGVQGDGERVPGRHEQRGAGRAVPRHQGVHPQPQGGPEGAQEPGEGGREAGPAAPRRPAGRGGAGAAAALPPGGAPAGHDGPQLPPGGLHLRPARAGRRAARVPGPAAPGRGPAPHRQVPRPHQPRLRPPGRLRLPGRALRAGRALLLPPAPHLRGARPDAGRGQHMTASRLPAARGGQRDYRIYDLFIPGPILAKLPSQVTCPSEAAEPFKAAASWTPATSPTSSLWRGFGVGTAQAARPVAPHTPGPRPAP